MRILKSTVIFVGFLIAGFLFRLWIARLVPQPFVYDQDEYYGYALGIINKGLHADLYRLYGYPLIVAPLIALFGVKSAMPWTVFHAVLDTMTAGLVYGIAHKVFKKTVPSWIAFILYLFNPFTAGYVGVLLSEVVTVFLITLMSVLFIRFFEKKSLVIFAFLSLLLGFLPQVRPVFIVLSIVVFGAICWTKLSSMRRAKERMINGLIALVLFSLPFWYTIAGNLVYYKQFSVLGVEPTFVRELYASLYIGRGMPFTDEKWGDWPVEAQNAWGAFTAPKDRAGREEVAGRHLTMAADIINRDPVGFIQSRIAKMGYVWEKHFIYPYVMGKPSPEAKALTYWGNLAVLLLAIAGMAMAFKRNKALVLAVFIFFLYISLAHMFSTSEERFSLPAYPWVAVFAGYGIWKVVGLLGFSHQGNAGGETSPSLLS
ncbi:MAG: hypothetical protein Q8L37_02755 [Candidatus Gottesmanbacteria bacterium]|nr:hypothetical protein [Candidatus Gottesmanbacteria bacterium]